MKMGYEEYQNQREIKEYGSERDMQE